MLNLFCCGSVMALSLAWSVSGMGEPRSKAVFNHPDMSNWVDPSEKFDLKKRQKLVQIEEGGSELRHRPTEADCSQFCDSSALRNRNDLIMLRHVLRSFITKYRSTGNTAEDFDVTLRLRRPQLELFERLLDSPDIMHSAPIIDAWNKILQTLDVQKEPISLDSFERVVGVRLNLISQTLFVVSMPILLIYIETKMRMSLLSYIRRIFQFFLVLSFTASIPWTWFRLYQEKVAEQQRSLMEKNDAHCEPLTGLQLLGRTFGGFFSMKPDASPCEKYYRALMVDPRLDVPPTMAVAVTITHFIMEPLKHIGKALGEFFQAILAPLPFYMYPVVLVFLLLVTLMVIITRSNYRIHLPWFLGRIEPGGRNQTPTSTPKKMSITGAEAVFSTGTVAKSLLAASSESKQERQLAHPPSPVEERVPKFVRIREPPATRPSRKGDTPRLALSKSEMDNRLKSALSRWPSCPDIQTADS